jgi:hypothetical protein
MNRFFWRDKSQGLRVYIDLNVETFEEAERGTIFPMFKNPNLVRETIIKLKGEQE